MFEDILFVAGNVLVLPAWLCMFFAPNWRGTQMLVRTCIVPLLVAICYVIALVTNIGQAEGSFYTLDDVARLFQDRGVVAAGWIHYLCFDLFVGHWVLRDSQRRGINHWLVVGPLFFTLMLGPLGLLLYFAMRRWQGRESPG